MKALTIRQPYALAIAKGAKTVENRTRLTTYRGDIAIHAGASWHRGAETDSRVRDLWRHWISLYERPDAAHLDAHDYRSVIAVAELYDAHVPSPKCCPNTWADDDAGAHWLLRDVRRLKRPVPARGALGLWLLPHDVEQAACSQLPTPEVPL